MAACIPPNNAIHLWFNDPLRNRQIYRDNQRLQNEDWRTVNPERGPVRGVPGRRVAIGGAGGRRR
jgi:hypothetical protein